MRIRLGTRGSELARVQSRWVAERLLDAARGAGEPLEVEEVILRTRGGADQLSPLHQHTTPGIFTRELERALLAGEIDLAVHSLKDLPTSTPAGLRIAAIPRREEPWDAWISAKHPDLIDLPRGATVATGSLRRRAQILHEHPHLRVEGIRGTFSVSEMTPAPGQGALALEIREGETVLDGMLRRIEDPGSRAEITAERTFLATLEGGCHLPIGALARATPRALTLVGMIATVDGERLVRMGTEGAIDAPEALGESLAGSVLRAGGAEILEEIAAHGTPRADTGDRPESGEPR